MPTPECQKRASKKYRINNMEYYAEKQLEYYYREMQKPEYKAAEMARQRAKYHTKKEFRAFLGILLD